MPDFSKKLLSTVSNADDLEQLKSWFNSYLEKELSITLGERKLNEKAAALLGFANHNQLIGYLKTPKLTTEESVDAVSQLFEVARERVQRSTSDTVRHAALRDYVEGATALMTENMDMLQDQYIASLGNALRFYLLNSPPELSTNEGAQWLQEMGLFIELDESYYFYSNDVVFQHDTFEPIPVVTLTADGRVINDEDIVNAIKQINAIYDDFDLRGKYKTDDVEAEFVLYDYPSTNQLKIKYSASFRGKMEFVKENEKQDGDELVELIVINPLDQTITRSKQRHGRESYYSLIGASHVEWLTLGDGITLVFDGEAKLNGNSAPTFQFETPRGVVSIIGKGLVIRSDSAGDSVSCSLTDETVVRDRISF